MATGAEKSSVGQVLADAEGDRQTLLTQNKKIEEAIALARRKAEALKRHVVDCEAAQQKIQESILEDDTDGVTESAAIPFDARSPPRDLHGVVAVRQRDVEISILQGEVAALSGKVAQLQSELSASTQELKTCEAEKRKQRENCEALHVLCEDTARQQIQANESRLRAEQQRDEERASHKKLIETRDSELATLRCECATLRTVAAETERSTALLRQVLAEKNSEVCLLRGLRSSVEDSQRAEGLGRDLVEADGTVEALKTVVCSEKERVRDLEEEIEEQQQQHEGELAELSKGYEQLLEAQAAEIKRLNDDLSTARNANESLLQQVASCREDIRKEHSKSLEYQEMLRLLQVDLSPATATVTVATVEPQTRADSAAVPPRVHRQCQTATISSDVDALSQRLRQSTAEYARKESQLNDALRELAVVKAAEETLREELEKARQLAWEQDNEVLTLRESTRRLHTELESAQSREAALNDTLRELRSSLKLSADSNALLKVQCAEKQQVIDDFLAAERAGSSQPNTDGKKEDGHTPGEDALLQAQRRLQELDAALLEEKQRALALSLEVGTLRARAVDADALQCRLDLLQSNLEEAESRLHKAEEASKQAELNALEHQAASEKADAALEVLKVQLHDSIQAHSETTRQLVALEKQLQEHMDAAFNVLNELQLRDWRGDVSSVCLPSPQAPSPDRSTLPPDSVSPNRSGHLVVLAIRRLHQMLMASIEHRREAAQAVFCCHELHEILDLSADDMKQTMDAPLETLEAVTNAWPTFLALLREVVARVIESGQKYSALLTKFFDTKDRLMASERAAEATRAQLESLADGDVLVTLQQRPQQLSCLVTGLEHLSTTLKTLSGATRFVSERGASSTVEALRAYVLDDFAALTDTVFTARQKLDWVLMHCFTPTERENALMGITRPLNATPRKAGSIPYRSTSASSSQERHSVSSCGVVRGTLPP